MQTSKEITLENLSKEEKASLLKLVRKLYDVFLVSGDDQKEISLKELLDLLTQGTHEAMLLHNKKRRHR